MPSLQGWSVVIMSLLIKRKPFISQSLRSWSFTLRITGFNFGFFLYQWYEDFANAMYCVKSVQRHSNFWSVFSCIRTRNNYLSGHILGNDGFYILIQYWLCYWLIQYRWHYWVCYLYQHERGKHQICLPQE